MPWGVNKYRQSRPRGGGDLGNEIGPHAHLIIPKESRVESGAAILLKEI
jgi:hypothetical protein